MPPQPFGERKFITDRMLGTLTRYLRFMGYDTASASDLRVGDRREDTVLLNKARIERRILLTKDAELARRGGEIALLVPAEDVMEQVQHLINAGLVRRRLTMSRCSLCNTELREATANEVEETSYAPEDRRNLMFWWCGRCHKLYWNGSHGRHLERRVEEELRE